MTDPVETAPLPCPHCGYDLSRLSSAVCPECGEPFDEENVTLHALGFIPTPLPAWRASGAGGVSAFFRTASSVLLHPMRIASWLPLWPDRWSMLWYRLGCSTLLFASCIVAALLGGWSLMVTAVSVLFLLCGWFGFSLAGALVLSAPTEQSSESAFRLFTYWRSFLDLFQAHLVAAAILAIPLQLSGLGVHGWWLTVAMCIGAMILATVCAEWATADEPGKLYHFGRWLVLAVTSIIAAGVVGYIVAVAAASLLMLKA